MNILEFLTNQEKYENRKIPLENHENHGNHRIPYENHENYEKSENFI